MGKSVAGAVTRPGDGPEDYFTTYRGFLSVPKTR